MSRFLAITTSMFILARRGCDAQDVPVPSPMEVDCFEVAREFYGSDADLIKGESVTTNPCPTGLPGVWDTCSTECAEGMQVALEELDCCLREYLNEFAGPGEDHGEYADMAFENVIPLCELDLSETESMCFDQFGEDSEEDMCYALADDFFESTDDLIQGPDVENPCPSGLPGTWEECSIECADGMQAALDELDCCLREYLSAFAGPGDHGEYADMAFSNVIPLCNLETTEGACFEEFVLSGAAHLSTSLIVALGSLFTVVALWSL